MIKVAFASLFAALSLMVASASTPSDSPAADAVAHVLSAAGFSTSGAEFPSSFMYGGQSSRILLPAWPREDKPPRQEADRTMYEITWREPGGGLVVTWTATAYKQWPAIEFRWTFRNDSAIAAKPLMWVQALDLSTTSAQHAFELIHSSGGLEVGKFDSPRLGYALSETPLGVVTLSAESGRSSNKDMPFFVVHGTNPDAGLFFGIGWSGQWQAVIDDSVPSTLHLTAQMPGMNLALPPGETIISPSILFGSFRGPWTTGANALRTMLYAKYTPLLDGKEPLPPVSWNSWFIFGNGINESLLEKQADIAAREGIEYFCIDSGWFDGGFGAGVGNWTVDRTKFPGGLKQIGDRVAADGMKLGLWFEPERAAPGTRLTREHPEWMHGDVVDLGNPAARDWLFNMMKGFIDAGHVRWIRWDFNEDPMPRWNAADAPNQKGLTQIRHIMGLYSLLDRIMKAYPDLLIEGCCGGGRRIDLETIKRSHTFWKSDATANVPILRFHETGANTFLPGQLLNTNLLPVTLPYDTDNILGGPFGVRCDWTKFSPAMLGGLSQAITLAKRLRPLINEDYYSLFPQRRDESAWTGWQFNSPTQQAGFVVLIRPSAAPTASETIALQGLDPDATYTLQPLHGSDEPAKQLTGAQLAQGWNVSLAPQTSAVYFYTK